MNLKNVFKERVARAAMELDRPDRDLVRIRFTSEDLQDEMRLHELHKKFPRKCAGTFYLYQISFEGSDADIEDLRASFRRVKNQSRLKMSRDNEAHANSNWLYVGTCENLYERFRTHLGKGRGATTWALYLSQWSVSQAKFTVEYYQFTETLHEDVELIEGILWDSLKPLFGKKSGLLA